MYHITYGRKKNSGCSDLHFKQSLLLFQTFPAQAIEFQFMIQDMESSGVLDMAFQIIEQIIAKRDHFITCPAYEMMMIVSRVTL